MIKYLVLVVALFSSALAYAANPSATLSVQIVPAAVSSGAPTPPQQATLANFDTCVVCIDFTASSGGVFVNGAAVAGAAGASPSTWLDCAGASSPIWFHKSNGAPTSSLPCPDIVNDGLGNPQVLRIWNGPLQNTANKNGMKLYDNDTATGIMAPTNNYMEATFVIPQFPNHGFMEGHWLGGGGEIPSGQYNDLEMDAFEVNGDLNPGAFGSVGRSWFGGESFTGSNWSGTFPPNYDSYNLSAQYLKIGQRITNDGTTLYKCMWINDVFQNCVHSSVNGSSFVSSQLSDATSRFQTYFILTGCTTSCPGPGTSSDMVAYAKSFYMWSCSSWRTIACKTVSADPGGY